MSDPREKLSPAESKPTAPKLDIPARRDARTPPPPASREAVPQHEINAMAEFIAGGASLDALMARWSDVAEEWFRLNWPSLLVRAARSTPVKLPTAAEQAAAEKEADRLDRLFGRRRPDDGPPSAYDFKVKRAIGR